MKQGKRWPGGVVAKRRNQSPSDIARKARRQTMPTTTQILDTIALGKMKVEDLRKLCDERGIKWNTKVRKAGLIEMLVGR